MGADLIVNLVELRETKEQALARLSRLIINESAKSEMEEAGYFYWEDEDYTNEIGEEIRRRIASSVEVVYGNSREMTLVCIDGNRTFAVTGGMSWGDAPTDILEDFNIFQQFLGYPSWCAPDSEEIAKWNSETASA
jgi:hypothetical protein